MMGYQSFTYYLLDDGLAVLKKSPDGYNPKVLAEIKRLRRQDLKKMWHYINVFRTFIRCRELYGQDTKFLTKSNLKAVLYFPKQLPDAYIVFNDDKTKETRRAMLEYYDWTKPLSAMKTRINDLIKYADSGAWTSRVPFPEVWLICETPELESKIRKWTGVALEQSWEDSTAFCTTTRKRFFDANGSEEVWQICEPATD